MSFNDDPRFLYIYVAMFFLLWLTWPKEQIILVIDVDVPAELVEDEKLNEILVDMWAQVNQDVNALEDTTCPIAQGGLSGWGCDLEERIRTYPPLSIPVGLALFVIIFRFRQVRQLIFARFWSRSEAVHELNRITQRFFRSETRAHLVVTYGDDILLNEKIEIYGDTPIGRSHDVAEVIFQENSPRSPLSRLHCTILDLEDHFLIRDEDSRAGTFINQDRLTTLVDHPIKDGDYVTLGQLARGGVRFQFLVANGVEEKIEREIDEDDLF